MKRLLLLVCALPLLAGCSFLSPQSNEPPEASITSISPTESTAGETVTFTGQGTDADGEVVGYRWRSDLDGEISQSPTFQTDSLSVGVHVIDFLVLDDGDAWSDKAHGSVKVLGSSTTATPMTSFTASPSAIEPGESATLSWSISDATSVNIDQGIGTVEASGSVVVTPTETTVYILTATAGGSTVARNVTVTVQQDGQDGQDGPAVQGENSITLPTDGENSGYIRSSGVERTVGIYVGDDDSDRGFQGFLTFDISDIPDHATITSVILDLSTYDTPYALPYPELGCMRAYVHEYSSLGNQYWTDDVPESIGEWCSFDELDMPTERTGLRDALQDEVGESKFQIRLQFSDGESDWDGTRDLLHWSRDVLPTLIVEYSMAG